MKNKANDNEGDEAAKRKKRLAKRWLPWDGAYRAAGKGFLGEHQGSLLYDLAAAQSRREKSLAPYVHHSWVEVFVNGSWKRVGETVETTDEKQENTQGMTLDPTLA